MRRVPRRLSAVGALSAAALAVAAPAAGAVDWSRPFDLSIPPVAAQAPAVGIDDAQRSVTVWESDVGPGRLQMRARDAGGALSPVATITSAGGEASSPAVAMNGAGVAAIAYRVFD